MHLAVYVVYVYVDSSTKLTEYSSHQQTATSQRPNNVTHRLLRPSCNLLTSSHDGASADRWDHWSLMLPSRQRCSAAVPQSYHQRRLSDWDELVPATTSSQRRRRRPKWRHRHQHLWLISVGWLFQLHSTLPRPEHNNHDILSSTRILC